MRTALIVLLAALLASTLWIGGELHRRTCVDAGRSSCSVLPWNDGAAPTVPRDVPCGELPTPRERLLCRASS